MAADLIEKLEGTRRTLNEATLKQASAQVAVDKAEVAVVAARKKLATAEEAVRKAREANNFAFDEWSAARRGMAVDYGGEGAEAEDEPVEF